MGCRFESYRGHSFFGECRSTCWAALLMPQSQIKALFLDVGGVLLTNGWDSKVRRALADHFRLDLADFEARHHLTFDTYESGKISFDVFLDRTVFYKPRDFTPADFK